MDVRVGLWRRLSAEELMLLKCSVGEESWESLGLQGDPISPFWRRSTLGFFGSNDAKAETPLLWPPHVKSWLIGKDPDSGKDWRQEEKRMTEDEMVCQLFTWSGQKRYWSFSFNINLSQHQVFASESVLRIRWPKYWEFQLQHQSFQGIFRTDFL